LVDASGSPLSPPGEISDQIEGLLGAIDG